MKKRILALFLAVCTVILSVPLLALPALADGTDEDAAIRAGLVTSYLPDVETTWTPAGDNWPAYQNGHVAYKGNWTLVQKTAASVSNLITGWDATNKVIQYNEAWTNGGMYQDSSSWKYGMIAGSGTGYATAVSYTSPYTGKVKIDLRSAEQFSDGTNDARCRVAIFVNGQMVWPNTGDYYADASKWYATTGKDDKIGTQQDTASLKTLAETGIAVEVGQRIELAVARLAKEDGSGTWGGRALGNVTLQLTFTDLTAYQNVAHIEDTYSYMYQESTGAVGTYPQHFKAWLADKGLTLVTTASDTLAVGDITYTDTDGNTAAKTTAERDALRNEWYTYYADFGRIGYEGVIVPGMLWNGSNGITGNLSFAPIDQVGYMTGKSFTTEWNGTNTGWDSWAVNATRYLTEESWAFKNNSSTAIDGWGTNDVGIWGKNACVARRASSALGCFTLAGNYAGGEYISIAAQQYTAPATGLASFTLLDGTNLNTIVEGNAPKFCLMIGDTVVYPATADIHDPDTWADGTDIATLNADLAKVKAWMQAGQTATFCYAAKAGGNIGSKNGEGRYADPQVTLQIDAAHTKLDATVVATYAADKFAANKPDNSTKPATFRGNWSVVNGYWSADISKSYASWSYDKTKDLFVNWDESGTVADRLIATNGLWAGNGGGFYVNKGYTVARQPSSLTGNAVLYTAPYDGVVDLDFTSLMFRREVTANAHTVSYPISIYFSITLNGEVIWPSTGRAWLYEGKKPYDGSVKEANSSDAGEKDALKAAKAYEAFPTVQVKAGDEIAFVVNMGNAATHMCEVMPKVTYLQTDLVCADTTVNVSATLDSDIRLTGNMKNGMVTMARYDESITTTETGAVSNTALTETVAFMANEMTQKGHYLATVQSGAQNVVVRAGTVSVADYCNKLITTATEDDTLKALAVATLNYGAEAQQYFDGETDATKLANYGLTGNTGYLSTDLSTLTATRDVGSLTDATGATITGATLVLKDKVHIKLYVTLKEGTAAEGLQVRYKVGAMEEYAELQLCDDGSGYKAYIAVPTSAFGSDYTIQIVKADGTQISNEVTYGVNAYAKQMDKSENGNLLRAIVALGNAAEAYVTAQP